MKICGKYLWLLLLFLVSAPAFGKTWYIRADGGTRHSAAQPKGQCDGTTNAAYPGRGSNQRCAFNDFRFMWDDQSEGSNAWVMAGGDTVVILGCAANANQQHPSAPDCRVGWDADRGKGGGYTWCFGGYGANRCYNPPIPSGTAAQHTRILGQCALTDTCRSGNATNRDKLVQVFGGFDDQYTLNLSGAKYVDVIGLEITEHNDGCIGHGSPAYPKQCNTNPPFDDFAADGILTTNTTSNVLLQDLYIHGFTNSGIQGPIGGPITMNRVFIGFNGFAGWDFDDGSNTPDAPGSSIHADYVTMEGNGCNEEYPIVHKLFPAKSCYDDESNGFGDSWSGQDTDLDSFTCNHCVQIYNTKDGFIGPHTRIKELRIENSESIGNMGQQWKWNNTPHATTVFQNNLTIGNCGRMSMMLPGAAQNFAKSAKMPGSYLSDFCRASGDTFSFSSQANSNVLFANNTVVSYSKTIFDIDCGPANHRLNTCGTTPFIFKNNIFLGYTVSWLGEAPGLFYPESPSVTGIAISSSYNLEYGVRAGDDCRRTILCSDPQFANEPGRRFKEQDMDNFNFQPSAGSPAVRHGVTISGLTTDYDGANRPTPPSIGALEPVQAAAKKN